MAVENKKTPSDRDKDRPLSPGSLDEEPKSTSDRLSDASGPSLLLLHEEGVGLTVPFDDKMEMPVTSRGPSGPLSGLAAESPEGEEIRVVRLDEASDVPPSAVSEPAPPLEEKMELPPLVEQPAAEASPTSPSVAKEEEEELRVIFLDEEAAVKPPPVSEPTARIETPRASEPRGEIPPPVAGATPVEEKESGAVLLDDLIAPTGSGVVARAPAAPEVVSEKPAISDFLDASEPSPLLIEEETASIPEATHPEESSLLLSETREPFDDSFLAGGSSLLLDTKPIVRPGAREEPFLETPRGKRRRRDRVRIVPPEPRAEVKWFSNPEACAAYCRKHNRPLLLYFTTGNVEQCRAYEETIRREEMRSFLCSYVCCMVNMALAEGRKVAMRLGVPTDGPAMVLLSPTGREYARVLKAEVDWRFLAAMLFWALQ